MKNDERVELHNNIGSDINLTGWRLFTPATPDEMLNGGEFYLLERTDKMSVPDRTADQRTTSG